MTKSSNSPSQIVLPEGFHINEVQQLVGGVLPRPQVTPPPLGVLSNFANTTFAGRGFNLIFRPNSTTTPTPLPNPNPQGPNDNVLELNLTTDNLAFSPSLGNIPNRGNGAQGDLFLNGVPYVQTVNDVTNGAPTAIHFEPGIWLAVPASQIPAEPTTIARMASIPHGTTIDLQGNSLPAVAGPPNIPPVDPTPFFSATRTPFRFPSQTANDPNTFRLPQDLTSFIAAGTITQAILDDPNTVLRNAIAGQTIVSTVTLEVASAPETPPGPVAIPAVGGGTANIAFLTANADVPNQQPGPGAKVFAGAKAIFWIETVEHEILLPVIPEGHPPIVIHDTPHPITGLAAPKVVIHPPFPIPRPIPIKVRFTQIQYSQVVLLNFNGLTWPHVSVATLVPSAAITPSPADWEAVRKLL